MDDGGRCPSDDPRLPRAARLGARRRAVLDLGCGDGAVAVTAAKLGFAPVHAVDIRPEAALATLTASLRAGVVVSCQLVDLMVMPAPFAPVVCANVPERVHVAIAAQLPDWPDYLVASGFDPDRFEMLADGYARLGLAPGPTITSGRWMSCLFER